MKTTSLPVLQARVQERVRVPEQRGPWKADQPASGAALSSHSQQGQLLLQIPLPISL
jgi:hypothetical protein